MRILVVEDHTLLGEGIITGLMQVGYSADLVNNGRDALTAVATTPYDLIILDLGLPQISGLDVLRKVRQQKNTNSIPVLILTARDTVPDRIQGLDSGADDYMIKPFELDELLARVRALLRRSYGKANPMLVHNDIILDPAAHQVTQGGKQIELSPREFALLYTLLQNAGRVMSRSQLENSLYSWNEEIESNTVEVHVHHLRKKLGAQLIRTIRGVGYLIEKPTFVG